MPPLHRVLLSLSALLPVAAPSPRAASAVAATLLLVFSHSQLLRVLPPQLLCRVVLEEILLLFDKVQVIQGIEGDDVDNLCFYFRWDYFCFGKTSKSRRQ